RRDDLSQGVRHAGRALCAPARLVRPCHGLALLGRDRPANEGRGVAAFWFTAITFRRGGPCGRPSGPTFVRKQMNRAPTRGAPTHAPAASSAPYLRWTV